MAGGSLKSALARRADIVAGPLTRVVLALDAAKVRGRCACAAPQAVVQAAWVPNALGW